MSASLRHRPKRLILRSLIGRWTPRRPFWYFSARPESLFKISIYWGYPNDTLAWQSLYPHPRNPLLPEGVKTYPEEGESVQARDQDVGKFACYRLRQTKPGNLNWESMLTRRAPNFLKPLGCLGFWNLKS